MTDDRPTLDAIIAESVDGLPDELADRVAAWIPLELEAGRHGFAGFATEILTEGRYHALVHEIGRLRADVANARHVDVTGEGLDADYLETISDRVAVGIERHALEHATERLAEVLHRHEQHEHPPTLTVVPPDCGDPGFVETVDEATAVEILETHRAVVDADPAVDRRDL